MLWVCQVGRFILQNSSHRFSRCIATKGTSSRQHFVQNRAESDEVEAVVLSIDVERERISLGIKQLSGDPYGSFVATHEKGSVVKGTVSEVRAKGEPVKESA